MAANRDVLAGMRDGRPRTGPLNVHIDVTNACNAACITCWDHSPLLATPRSPAWKRRSLPGETFDELVRDLDSFGSVRSVILSGMGEPLVHPDIYEMIEQIVRRGWHLTVLTNLIAADIDRLADSGVNQLLVGVHGATPATYAAFHPGWTERDFNAMCAHLRRLARAGVRCRHVHVINRDTAPELVDMVRFGKLFGADRVNFKLASLYGGTEDCSITDDQRAWLASEGVPAARATARELGVATNLDLFERQLGAALIDLRATTPMADVGCYMGYVYTRITVDLDVLYCCNTQIKVGNLRDGPLSAQWYGDAWQGLRDRIAAGDFFRGCDKCGKFEQNVKWAAKVRALPPSEAR